MEPTNKAANHLYAPGGHRSNFSVKHIYDDFHAGATNSILLLISYQTGVLHTGQTSPAVGFLFPKTLQHTKLFGFYLESSAGDHQTPLFCL